MYTDRIKIIELQLVDEKVRKLKQSEPYKEKKNGNYTCPTAKAAEDRAHAEC